MTELQLGHLVIGKIFGTQAFDFSWLECLLMAVGHRSTGVIPDD